MVILANTGSFPVKLHQIYLGFRGLEAGSQSTLPRALFRAKTRRRLTPIINEP